MSRFTHVHTTVVLDIDGNERFLALGIEDGEVVGHGPRRWRLDPDKVDRLIGHLEKARDAARAQRDRS